MRITPRRCIIWAAVCFAVGTLLSIWVPDLLHWLSTDALRNENVLYAVSSFLVSLIQWTLMPLGGALVASAVVIAWLKQQQDQESLTGSTDPAPRP